MSFDEQTDADPHGECATEIKRLNDRLEQINMIACYASEEDTDSREIALLAIGRIARDEPSPLISPTVKRVMNKFNAALAEKCSGSTSEPKA